MAGYFIDTELTVCAVDGYFVSVVKALTMLSPLLNTPSKKLKNIYYRLVDAQGFLFLKQLNVQNLHLFKIYRTRIPNCKLDVKPNNYILYA